MHLVRRYLALGLCAATRLSAADLPAALTPGHTLWYDQPAQKWTDALPIGNGRMGAMVHGGIDRERLQLN